jgi:hypothetical protein
VDEDMQKFNLDWYLRFQKAFGVPPVMAMVSNKKALALRKSLAPFLSTTAIIELWHPPWKTLRSTFDSRHQHGMALKERGAALLWKRLGKSLCPSPKNAKAMQSALERWAYTACETECRAVTFQPH